MDIAMLNASRLRLAGTSFFVLATLAAAPAYAADASEGERDDTIVVTAAGYEQKIKEAPASISVLDRENLQDKRFGSLAEALQDVQGVDVGGEAGKTGGLTISIRGMPSDYTLVLIDGRRQNAPGNVTPNGFGESSTSFLPPFSAIERIEVVRGPMSTLYGSDAMGGVVNIITRKVGDHWAGTVSAETTFQEDERFGNIHSANAYAQGPVVKGLVGLTLRGSILHREGSDIPIPGNPALTLGRNPVTSDIATYGGRLTLTPHDDHDLWFEYDRNEQTYDNNNGQLGTLGEGGYATQQRFNRENYVAAHSWRIGGAGGFGALDTTFTRNTTETIGRTAPPGTPGVIAGSPRTLESRNDILDSRLAAKLGAVAFTIGGQYWWARMVDGVAPAPFEFTQWAGFAEATLTIADGFNITGGARYDRHSTFGGKWSPRAYAVWNITDAFTVKGGVSRGFKTPRLEQIAEGIIGFGSQGRVPLIGTPGLKPETSTSYEAGLYYDGKGFLSGNVTLFHTEFKDKIASGPGIANCQFSGNLNRPGCLDVGPFPSVDLFGQSINIDEAVTRGVEVTGKLAFTPTVSLGLTYTYTDTEQKSGPDRGLPLVGTPEHMFNGNLRWKLNDKASLWSRAEIRSSRWRGSNAQQAAVGDFRSYEVFHIGGSYQFTPTFRVAATVFNVLNTDYARYVGYCPSVAPCAENSRVYTPAYSINQEGRRFWIQSTFDF